MNLMELVPNSESDNSNIEPKIIHDCKVLPEEDQVNIFIKGNSLWSRFRRWITRKRILSAENYYAKTCLKSRTAINFEISHHLQNFPYIIHPFSPFRNFWDVIMTLFTLASLTLTPYLVTFSYDNRANYLVLIILINFVMLFDIILQFFTGWFDSRTKTVTLDPKSVFAKYIKGAFIFDFVTTIPFDLVDFMWHRSFTHTSWYCTSLNLVKIIRMRNLIHYIHHFHKTYQVSFRNLKIILLLIIGCMSLHWAACLVYYVPMVVTRFIGPSVEEAKKSWIYSDSMKKRKTMKKQYILCLNRATISFVSAAHYLDVITIEDMIMDFCLAILGKIGFVYLLSQLQQIMTTSHSSHKERMRLLQQLQEYMRYKELPLITQKKLRLYCNYWYKRNFNRDSRILAQVSGPLREELILHSYMAMLETVDLIKLLPRSAIVDLGNFIRPEIYLSGDVIVKSNTEGDSLFFVGSGTVAVYTNFGKEICHLEDGAYFGEIALVMENELRAANVVAIETTEILIVPREAFQRVIAPYPNLLSHLQKVALERLEKTLLMEEIYTHEDSQPRYINISNIRGRRRD